MDSLQPPHNLQQLWLNRQVGKEELETILTRALRDVSSFRACARRNDIATAAFYALLLPLCLLCILIARYHFGEPLVAAGYAMWCVFLLAGLAAHRLFYRSLRNEPSPDVDSRDYLEHFIEYLNQRERFIIKWAAPMSALLGLAGIVFAIALYRGQDALFQVIVSFIAQPATLWLTLRTPQSFERKRLQVRKILADLNGES